MSVTARRSLLLSGISLCLAATAVFAQQEDSLPAGASAEAGAESLIQALRSPEMKIREEAHQKLVGMGRKALQALRRAVEDPEPEVRSRARAILERIGHEMLQVDRPFAAGERPSYEDAMGRKISSGLREVPVWKVFDMLRLDAGLHVEIGAGTAPEFLTATVSLTSNELALRHFIRWILWLGKGFPKHEMIWTSRGFTVGPPGSANLSIQDLEERAYPWPSSLGKFHPDAAKELFEIASEYLAAERLSAVTTSMTANERGELAVSAHGAARVAIGDFLRVIEGQPAEDEDAQRQARPAIEKRLQEIRWGSDPQEFSTERFLEHLSRELGCPVGIATSHPFSRMFNVAGVHSVEQLFQFWDVRWEPRWGGLMLFQSEESDPTVPGRLRRLEVAPYLFWRRLLDRSWMWPLEKQQLRSFLPAEISLWLLPGQTFLLVRGPEDASDALEREIARRVGTFLAERDRAVQGLEQFPPATARAPARPERSRRAAASAEEDLRQKIRRAFSHELVSTQEQSNDFTSLGVNQTMQSSLSRVLSVRQSSFSTHGFRTGEQVAISLSEANLWALWDWIERVGQQRLSYSPEHASLEISFGGSGGWDRQRAPDRGLASEVPQAVEEEFGRLLGALFPSGRGWFPRRNVLRRGRRVFDPFQARSTGPAVELPVSSAPKLARGLGLEELPRGEPAFRLKKISPSRLRLRWLPPGVSNAIVKTDFQKKPALEALFALAERSGLDWCLAGRQRELDTPVDLQGEQKVVSALDTVCRAAGLNWALHEDGLVWILPEKRMARQMLSVATIDMGDVLGEPEARKLIEELEAMLRARGEWDERSSGLWFFRPTHRLAIRATDRAIREVRRSLPRLREEVRKQYESGGVPQTFEELRGVADPLGRWVGYAGLAAGADAAPFDSAQGRRSARARIELARELREAGSPVPALRAVGPIGQKLLDEPARESLCAALGKELVAEAALVSGLLYEELSEIYPEASGLAGRYCQVALGLDPEPRISGEACRGLAAVSRRIGKPEKAAEWLRKALEHGPEPESEAWLAWLEREFLPAEDEK